MLYTDKTVRFSASEIDAYRAQGIDVTQITTHRQFLQLMKASARKQRRVAKTKEESNMGKRYGRRRSNGMMEYSNSYEELVQSGKQERAALLAGFFGIVGLIAGGILTYMLMQRLQLDSRWLRFGGVIAGCMIGCRLGAVLSPLLGKIVKWTILLTIISGVAFLIFWLV